MDPVSHIVNAAMLQWPGLFPSPAAVIRSLSPEHNCEPIPKFRVYMLWGPFLLTKNAFDYHALPSATFTHFYADGRRAIRLRFENRVDIESVLQLHYARLHLADPVHLARLILMVTANSNRQSNTLSHRIVTSIDDLIPKGVDRKRYLLNPTETEAFHRIPKPRIEQTSETIHLTVTTSYGWMHEKQNLGIEQMEIQSNGKLSFSPREVLTEKLYSSWPQIMY